MRFMGRREAMRGLASLALLPLAAACTPAQAANTISTIEGYLQYLSTFVSVAQGIWAVISPLLGSSVTPQANAEFNRAVQALNDAEVAIEDALAAARAANNPNPDLTLLIANATAAADQIVAVIRLYSAPATTANARAGITTLQHMQITIHGWH